MIPVLYARARSIYHQIPGCDVWDAERDARSWPGGRSLVAHPPCRLWGSLRSKSKAPIEEKELALHAIDAVRRWGGVLEHPEQSTLWDAVGVPRRGYDGFGGWKLVVSQKWWGHLAEKRTGLYIVGVPPRELPPLPLVLGQAQRTVGLWSGRDRSRALPQMKSDEASMTPRPLAEWLVEIARRAELRKTAN